MRWLHPRIETPPAPTPCRAGLDRPHFLGEARAFLLSLGHGAPRVLGDGRAPPRPADFFVQSALPEPPAQFRPRQLASRARRAASASARIARACSRAWMSDSRSRACRSNLCLSAQAPGFAQRPKSAHRPSQTTPRPPAHERAAARATNIVIQRAGSPIYADRSPSVRGRRSIRPTRTTESGLAPLSLGSAQPTAKGSDWIWWAATSNVVAHEEASPP